MHKIKLIALDLDGTLLDAEKRLSAENAAALARAAGEGVEIVPATGRFYRGMPQIIKDLPYVNYVIAVNGADVFDVTRRQTLFSAGIPWQRAVAVMEYMDALDVIYDCYQNGWGWMTRSFYDKAEAYAANIHSLDMIKNLRTPVPELKAYLAERAQDVQKIQIFFRDMALRAELLKTLPARFPDLVVTSSIVNNIEFNSRKGTKGIALTRLASFLGISWEDTVAFGDDRNDISMLECAGIGVAMGNACEEVQEAADFITDDCGRSGVASAMRELLWRNEL